MLEFKVDKQVLSLINNEIVVSDTIKYLTASFSFSDDWKDAVKTVHFKKDDVIYDIVLENDQISKDDNLNLDSGKWQIYVHGYVNQETRITTTNEYIFVKQSGILNGQPLPEIPVSISEQILLKADNAQKIALKIQQDAQDGLFNGEKGDKGEKGETGLTPNITIGNVETVSSSEPASVNLRGTQEDPILDFSIPKGDKGDKGEIPDLSELENTINQIKSDAVSKSETSAQTINSDITLAIGKNITGNSIYARERMFIDNKAVADIERGTWNPTSASGTFRYATYMRIGDLCYISCIFDVKESSINDALKISGLPFPPVNNSFGVLNTGYTNAISYTSADKNEPYSTGAIPQINAGEVKFFSHITGRSWGVYANCIKAGEIVFGGVYPIAE